MLLRTFARRAGEGASRTNLIQRVCTPTTINSQSGGGRIRLLPDHHFKPSTHPYAPGTFAGALEKESVAKQGSRESIISNHPSTY
jgi:hypothetical protein